jgi:Fic family protein
MARIDIYNQKRYFKIWAYREIRKIVISSCETGMKRKTQGRYVTSSTGSEEVRAFVPAPLPPKPPIAEAPMLREKFDNALLALGNLDSVATLLPATSMFLYMYVRKEAVLSSMIEGTQSSLSDLLLFEIDEQPGVPLEDVMEVSNYVAALAHGLKRIRSGFPLSLRLMREMHKILLSKGRGSRQSPGEFRRSQNWIGGTRPGNAAFVPPPPHFVNECMGKLELFIHDKPIRTPVLFKAALAHVQFETIHPFLDGNGRLGRMLITLLLCSEGVLKEPILYLSLYFKTHRRRYYELLNDVRLEGDWESWLEFFADAVISTASEAAATGEKLVRLADADSERIKELGRISGSVSLVHRGLLERPIASPTWLSENTGLAYGTVAKSLERLGDIGIVKEITGRRRNRVYAYTKYIEIMNK